MTKYDVIVVGAGPAGSTAARHCSMNNLKTLLLEKEKLPRYKVCAGGLSLAALKELDFMLPDSIIERECHGVRVEVGDFYKIVKDEKSVAFMVTRKKFDGYLLEKARQADAEVHELEECVDVIPDIDKVTVRTRKESYQANIVIGADGFYSRVLKAVRSGFDKDEIWFCVIAEIPLEEKKISDFLGDIAIIRYGFIDRGYAWLFPKRDYLSAGIGGAFPKSRNLAKRLKEFLAIHSLKTDIRIRGWFIPVSRFRHNVYAKRIMLTGDAAGFVDSFTGEGIRFAISSGRIAAMTAVSCHETGNFTEGSVKDYQKLCYEIFGNDLKYSSKVADLYFRYSKFVLDTVMRSDDAMNKYLKIMTGELTYKEYTDWFKRRMPQFLIKRIISSKDSLLDRREAP